MVAVILDGVEGSQEAAQEAAVLLQAVEAIAEGFEAVIVEGAAETFEVDLQEEVGVVDEVAAALPHRHLRLSALRVNQHRNRRG